MTAKARKVKCLGHPKVMVTNRNRLKFVAISPNPFRWGLAG
jgi:hypothetical protein